MKKEMIVACIMLFLIVDGALAQPKSSITRRMHNIFGERELVQLTLI